jgi:hypothetical protein
MSDARGGGLAAAMSVVLVGVAGTADTPENSYSPIQESPSTTSSMVGGGCSVCARYLTPEFRLHAQGLVPWSSDSMSRRVNEKLCAGFQVAVRRLRDLHACHDLFSRLGFDGIDEIAATLYYPAALDRESSVCSRAVAFTVIGAKHLWLCRRFSAVTDEYAAMTLIHEGLHRCGLNEGGPKNPNSAHICRVVSRACDL